MNGRMLRVPAIAAVATAAVSVSADAITPVDGGAAGGTTITINDGPGEQTEPRVEGNLAAYTDYSSGEVHYFDFTTSVDHAITRDPGSTDSLVEVSGSRIAFSRQTGSSRHVVVYDAVTASAVVIDPPTVHLAFQTAIAGDTVVFVDGMSATGEIQVADLSAPTAPVTNLSASPNLDANPNIAPNGDVVVWEACVITFGDCHVLRSVRTGGVWASAEVVAATTTGNELNPDTDGVRIVYESDRPGPTGPDIFWQPVAGGAETQLSLPGIQRNPAISAGVISFESKTSPGSPADLFVYVVATNRVFRVTNTPTVDESLNDISELPNRDVRLVWANDEGHGGERNVYARTFTLPGLDSTPPVITPTVTGTLGTNGWYTSDVGLTWNVSEPESPASVVTSGCTDRSITTDQAATTYACATSSDGGSAGPVEVSIKRDATAPTLTFSGNAGSYDVSQTLTIGCAASDNLSGVATDCTGIDEPASAFPPGPNTVNRSAIDNAGNTGTASATFTVVLNPAGLCALTTQYVRSSPAYQALGPGAKRLVDATVAAVCRILLGIGPQLLPAQKALFVSAYLGGVRALTRAGWLTATQASTLTTLAHGL